VERNRINILLLNIIKLKMSVVVLQKKYDTEKNDYDTKTKKNMIVKLYIF